MKHCLDADGLHYYTFHAKSEKPVKTVVMHLPANTPAQDIFEALEALGFEVMNASQMTAKRPQHGRAVEVKILPLFLTTLPRISKSQDIFKLTAL
jgi:hypothetical protein